MNASIYISGIDTNKCQQSDEILKSVTDDLKSMGFKVVNPTMMPFAQVSWTDNVVNRLSELGFCGAIYMLPHWRDDIMSRIELTAAMNQKLHALFHPASPEELRELQTALDV